MSPLWNATADECAQYVVSLFSDYTRMVTMQNHDGGLFQYDRNLGSTDMIGEQK
jgi:polysaccharide deacetylase 2 family uncharacterized protein YibQ